jgi:hypothetical protein
MNRLQKFVEQGPYGEKPGRTAYAFGPGNLPEPSNGLQWKPVTPFSAADEVMRDAGLKDVFKAAIAKGCAIVEARSTRDDPP